MIFPEDCDVICIDHWSEALYAEALRWVNATRRVFFISEEARQSVDQRVQIYHLETPLQLDGFIQQIAWGSVLKKLKVYGAIEQPLQEAQLAAHLILAESADWHVTIMQNARVNLAPYQRGLDLAGAFANVPAIIIGAGPSLKKNGHLLKHLTDKALLFAGGSAIGALDIEPHFAGSIDPLAIHRPLPHIPFCYLPRVHPQTLAKVEAPKLLFPDGACSAINALYGETMWDSGWTVGNFLTAVALHMGCSPIIFVGMDFCYQQGNKYPHLHTPEPTSLIEARGAVTQRDWLMAAQWSEKLARKHRLINATEGGILQLAEATLQTLSEQLPVIPDLRKRVAHALEHVPMRDAPSYNQELVRSHLLESLWQVWKPLFAREVEENPSQQLEWHRIAFEQQVLQAHG